MAKMTAQSPPSFQLTALVLTLCVAITHSLHFSPPHLPSPSLPSSRPRSRILGSEPGAERDLGVPAAMEDGEWVLLRRLAEKDYWDPTTPVKDDDTEGSRPPLKVTSSEPAKHWTDALPIGNGRLGAMVWGGVANDTLQLNEDTLWTGTPGNYTNPDAPAALSVVRKLVDNGQYAEATEAAVRLSGNPSDVYQLLGDINFKFDDSHLSYDEGSYIRELDLETAMVMVKYAVGGVEFTREYFASYPDQAIVLKLSASKLASISFTVSLDSKLHHHTFVTNGSNQIVMQGSCPGTRIAPSDNDNPKGIQFSAVLNIQVSGDKAVITALDDKKVSVKDTDWAVLVLVASSSFDGPFTEPSESQKDPTSDSMRHMGSIGNLSYSNLLARHLDDYQSLFHRASIQLSKSVPGENVGKKTTAERVKSFRDDEDPSLVELLFQYGRYLLISSSRPGTQVANLQGIWNDKIEPPWDGAPHLNVNLQMNYWSSLSCNLRECQEPLFDYISSLSVNGKKTAEVNYGANGWVAHQVSDIWAKTSPDRGQAVWALWPMGGAWLCTHLWEHYTYTLDIDFLKVKAYPLLEGCTSFLLDWLIEGRGGYLETNPSTSPEHTFIAPDGKPASVSYSTTMDMAIIKEVFSAIVSAAEILGRKEDALVKRVVEALPKLLPTKIARDGSIMEWAQDFKDPEIHHRHLSHLFGLFPGHTISVEETPDLSKAANHTLYKRGEEGPGWSTIWKIALWARLHNNENAYRMVKHLFDLVDPDHEGNYEGGLYSNLFTAHPPFQIDANLGFPAAVAEMLVQSTVKDLYLLPALPQDKWPNGCVKGLKARGGLTINICWREGDLHEFGIWLNNQNAVTVQRLHYRGTTTMTNIYPGKVHTFNEQLKCVKTNSL
ncbi:alpha-L-fucosidase 2-like [Punica granatum]|uniref:Alpha-L-fucosidase 2-like n=1 Tax=Punica granatum TaxID=22663 RepID=A0A6P8CID9_PUNGR|nr:alpha-L-fucosidase 2-like [Punica granatum]